jgi:hypothetical protein
MAFWRFHILGTNSWDTTLEDISKPYFEPIGGHLVDKFFAKRSAKIVTV